MNYPPKQIKIGNSTFEVSGYGRLRSGLCFAYNDEECLLYPEDKNLFRQRYRLAEISGTDGNEIKSGSGLQDLSYTLTLINDEGGKQTFKTNDSTQRRSIVPEDLLFVKEGTSEPTDLNPDAKNTDYIAIQKHQDKDLYSIDPIKVLDLVSFSTGSLIQFESDQLRFYLKKNGKLGYVLGPTIMLMDLAPDDFKHIFEGEYLPTGFTCDLRARQHTILFECSGRTEEIRGKARFIPTPQKIQELYTGEIRNRLNIRSLNQNDKANDEKVAPKTASCEQAPAQEADQEDHLRSLINEPERKENDSSPKTKPPSWQDKAVIVLTEELQKINSGESSRKVTPAWLAEQIGVSRSTVTRFLKGKKGTGSAVETFLNSCHNMLAKVTRDLE